MENEPKSEPKEQKSSAVTVFTGMTFAGNTILLPILGYAACGGRGLAVPLVIISVNTFLGAAAALCLPALERYARQHPEPPKSSAPSFEP